jgi:site-specific recombinase XerD
VSATALVSLPHDTPDTLATRAASTGLSADGPVGLWLRNLESVQSQDSYLRRVLSFGEWLGRERLRRDVTTATFEDILAYREYLEGLGRKVSTVQNHLRTLSSLYSFLVARGVLAAHPMTALKIPSETDETTKRAWTMEEFGAFMHIIPKDTVLGLRDRALFGLLFRNGPRVSEVVGANVGDLAVKSGHAVLEVRGKGRKRGDMVLVERTLRPIAEYLEARGIHAGAVLKTEAGASDWRALPLFLASDGAGRPRQDGGRKDDTGRMSRKTVNARMHAYGLQAGIDPAILHPHAARHTFASVLAEQGVPLHQIQVATRHASLAALQKYLHQQERILNNAAKRFPWQ